jgi:hypothetical protein
MLTTRSGFAPPLGALLLLTVAVAAPAARAEWQPLTEPNLESLAQPGAIRTADDALHVIYRTPNAAGSGAEDTYTRRILPDGTVGPPAFVETFEDGFANPDLTTTSDGLLALLPGLSEPPYGNIGAAFAPLAGQPWSPTKADVVENGNGAFYTQSVGATTDFAGVPYFAGASSVHRGLNPEVKSVSFQEKIGGGCCSYEGNMATDGATGQVFVTWFSNATDHQGVYIGQVNTSTGAATGVIKRMPGSVTKYDGRLESSGNFFRTPITGRPGLPGIWTAWPEGYPSQKAIALFRLGEKKYLRLPSQDTAEVEVVDVTGAPDGRLWLVSGEYRSGMVRVVARRSNTTVTRWGARSVVGGPAGNQRLQNITAVARGNGVVGVFGHFDVNPGDYQLYYSELRPALTVTRSHEKLKQNKAVTFKVHVTDAGDPVPNVLVKLSTKPGTGFSGKTAADGFVSLSIPPLEKSDLANGKNLVLKAAKSGYRVYVAPVKLVK